MVEQVPQTEQILNTDTLLTNIRASSRYKALINTFTRYNSSKGFDVNDLESAFWLGVSLKLKWFNDRNIVPIEEYLFRAGKLKLKREVARYRSKYNYRGCNVCGSKVKITPIKKYERPCTCGGDPTELQYELNSNDSSYLDSNVATKDLLNNNLILKVKSTLSNDQKPLLSCIMGEQSLKETASTLHISVQSTYRRISRFKKLLKENLKNFTKNY